MTANGLSNPQSTASVYFKQQVDRPTTPTQIHNATIQTLSRVISSHTKRECKTHSAVSSRAPPRTIKIDAKTPPSSPKAMADNPQDTQALRAFDTLCERSFTPDFSLKRARRARRTSRTPNSDAPFPQHGSSREWMAAEAGRLYSFSAATASAHSPDSHTSRASESATCIEVLGTSNTAGKRRASSFEAFRTKFRRLSSSVAAAIPVRMPGFMKKKTRTYESMEGWSWEGAQRRAQRPGGFETADVEARMMSATVGIC